MELWSWLRMGVLVRRGSLEPTRLVVLRERCGVVERSWVLERIAAEGV